MKEYKKPIIEDEEIQIEDICDARSTVDLLTDAEDADKDFGLPKLP